MDEVPGSEQAREVVRSVLGCKGTRDESIDEEVSRPQCETLRKRSQLKQN